MFTRACLEMHRPYRICVHSCAFIREIHNFSRCWKWGSRVKRLVDAILRCECDTFALVGWWVTFTILPWRMLHYFYGVLAWALWFTSLQAFPATPIRYCKASPPVPPMFPTSRSHEWIVRNPTRTIAHHRPVNYSRWYARFWLAVNAFGDPRGTYRGWCRVLLSLGEIRSLAACALTAIYSAILVDLSISKGITIIALVYDRITCC